MTKQRARNAEDKEARRRAILDAALEIWAEGVEYGALNMAEVAERAGLAKGTVYIYFETKESVMLALLERELGAWFDAIDARLDGGGGAWTARRVANLLASSLEEREPLTRLLTLVDSILEHNVPYEAARAFKVFLRGRMLATGARLEARLSFLGPAGGARLLMMLHVLVVGLRLLASPAPVARRAIDEDPDLALFRVDFGRELAGALAIHLGGLERAGGMGAEPRLRGEPPSSTGAH
jgi:AcrR family transcriptional regulator